jgi:hypothetical protein
MVLRLLIVEKHDAGVKPHFCLEIERFHEDKKQLLRVSPGHYLSGGLC